jgi:hypothetical protein
LLGDLTVKRCDHGSSADTETSDEATDVDRGNLARGGCLHDRTDDGHDSGQDEVVTTPDFISNKPSAQCSDEAATLESCHNVGLKIRKWYTDQP